VADVLPLAERWFERQRVDDAITLLREPHVVPLMRCNIWHLRVRDRLLLVDSGMGLVRLADLAEKEGTAVATHGHNDHIDGFHEFTDVRVHPPEEPLLLDPPLDSLEPRVS
jgi:glyoxylase-like metal-dependent hydrolase (beta-lactamase superfamily II)